MRHRVRIQPYLSPDVHRKLRAYASSNRMTESGVAEEALARYLAGGQVEEALVLRRLDALSQSVKGLQRDQEVLAQAVVHVAKFLFRIGAGSAPDAKAQAERRYERVVAQVAEELKAGVSLTGDVRRASSLAAPPRPATAPPVAPQRGGNGGGACYLPVRPEVAAQLAVGDRVRTGVVAMSLFDERALREIVAEELRRVLREELAAGRRPANDAEYLPVAEAAARAAVAPATIRGWMAQGRLGRYHAGRELRVLSSELVELLRRPAVMAGIGNREELTPEKEADLYLERRRARAAKRG